jgi:hypothetical protein
MQESRMKNEFFDLDLAERELENVRAHERSLSKLVEHARSYRARFSAGPGTPKVEDRPKPKLGLTRAVMDIIDGLPQETFTTARIRRILKSSGVDVERPNFGSSLSTTLTRLGAIEFVTIGQNDEGRRTYQRKEAPAT